jgi:uncharacterized protein involved in outer membrane biogenesis
MTAAALPPKPRQWPIPRPVRWIGGVIAALILAVVLVLTFADWNALRPFIGRQASAMSGRTIRLDGDLKVHPWSWTPYAEVGGLKIGNPRWASNGTGLMADIPKATIGIHLMSLLTGHWDLTRLELDHPRIWLFVDRDGRANWRTNLNDDQPTKLPLIERFLVDGGKLGFADMSRKLTIGGAIESHEVARASGGGSFHLDGNGTINARPFVLTITGAPLLNVNAKKPYNFNADMRAGDTRLIADGVLPKPFDFGQVEAQLTVSGRNFADLYDISGLALPNTPPFKLSGDLNRQANRYTFTKVHGTVGSSDLAGDFQVDRVDGRRKLTADLHSRSLLISDLGSLVGAPEPSVRTPAEQAAADARKAEGRLLPDATLNLAKIRSTDAVVHYQADSVKSPGWLPISKASLDLKLDRGVLTMTPLVFSLPQGDVDARIRIDARTDTPKDDIDVRVKNARLENMFRGSANPPVEGTLEARAELHGVGDSVHKAASTANGTVAIAVPNGQMRQLFAEALGIDATKAVGLLIDKSQKETGVRCALADFSANNGVLTARNLVLDTDPVLAKGSGTIDLRTETLDLSLEGKPKTFRLVRVKAPITLTGQILSPHVGIKAGRVPLQAAEAVGLAVVATPLAAVIPFLDPGLAKNADCASLLSEAEQKGAPVKPSQAPPVNAPHPHT